MNLTTLKGDIDFWDRFAPWYEKWASRGQYHRPILFELTKMIEQGWKILDVGAATGVLSIPLTALGCKVTALEPSRGMIKILENKLIETDTSVDILNTRWEDYAGESRKFNLILCCNSLHLTEGGIKGGMKKVFSLLPEYVCLITEINQSFTIDFKEIDRLQDNYQFLYIRNYRCDSSFHFEDENEVREFSALTGKEQKTAFIDGRIVQRDWTEIAVLWWERLI